MHTVVPAAAPHGSAVSGAILRAPTTPRVLLGRSGDCHNQLSLPATTNCARSSNGPGSCSCLVLISRSGYHPLMLFEIPGHELSDTEIAAVLHDAIAGAGRFPRHTELWFAGICTQQLVDGLRLAGLIVIRPAPMRLTE